MRQALFFLLLYFTSAFFSGAEARCRNNHCLWHGEHHYYRSARARRGESPPPRISRRDRARLTAPASRLRNPHLEYARVIPASELPPVPASLLHEAPRMEPAEAPGGDCRLRVTETPPLSDFRSWPGQWAARPEWRLP
jgi:hypothetical protein